MNRQDLQTLLDYHYWARDRVLAAVDPLPPEQFIKDMGNSFRSIRDTLAHIYSAEWAWHSRWTGQSPAALRDPNEFPDAASIRRAWAAMEDQVRAFASGLGDDIERVYEYKLISGAPGASPFWQMLQHVVNHASYHRGQVTTMLRQLGAKPAASMDMIAFYRERPQQTAAGR